MLDLAPSDVSTTITTSSFTPSQPAVERILEQNKKDIEAKHERAKQGRENNHKAFEFAQETANAGRQREIAALQARLDEATKDRESFQQQGQLLTTTLNNIQEELKELKHSKLTANQNDINAQLLLCMQGITAQLAPSGRLRPPTPPANTKDTPQDEVVFPI